MPTHAKRACAGLEPNLCSKPCALSRILSEAWKNKTKSRQAAAKRRREARREITRIRIILRIIRRDRKDN
jgi:hypothetical protein